LKRELKECRQVLGARKERKDGQRLILKRHAMVTLDQIQQIQELEKQKLNKVRKSQVKMLKGTRKR
jgi:hypothetical protein